MTAAQPRLCTSFSVGGTTYRHSTEDFYDSSDHFYTGSLMEYPDLRSRLQERNWGTYERETVRLLYGNADNAWNTLLAAQELRGVDIALQSYDAETGGAPVTKMIGQIISVDAREQVVVMAEMRRYDVLETKIPTKVVKTADFPKATDLGAAINILSGQAKAVPLRYIHYDFDNDYYDYLICEPGTNQTLSSVDTVYRDGKIVNSSEYTVYDGTQGSPHGGYAFIRFAFEQRDYDGRLHRLTADVTMGSRDFADYIKEILTESAWGLGESVNAASFSAAKSALSGIGDMYCDGGVTVKRAARDVIDDLLDKCRGHLDRNTSGEWTLDIDDAYDSTSQATFGFDDGIYNNILEIKDNSGTRADEALRSITLQYGRQADGAELIYENTRSVFAFGKDEIVRTDFVNNHTTADKYTCWRKNLAIYSDKGMTIVVGEEGRDLAVRDVITIDIPGWSISSARYRIEDIIHGESTFELVIKEYSSSIYSYAAGSIPDSANSDIGGSWGVGDVQLPSGENLIAYYKFDRGTGGGVLDHTGHGHDGVTVHGGDWVDGVSGYALEFDDTDESFVLIGDHDDLDAVECFHGWINPMAYHAASGENDHIIVSKHTGGNFGVYLGYDANPNRINVIFEDSAGTVSTASADITDYVDSYDEWIFVVGQKHPTLDVVELFINGGRVALGDNALIDTDGYGTNKSSADVFIGGGVTNRYSKCRVDDLGLRSGPLTAPEIRAMWLDRAGTGATILEEAAEKAEAVLPPDENLVGYWNCNDDGSTTELLDNSGNGQTISSSGYGTWTFTKGVSGDCVDGTVRGTCSSSLISSALTSALNTGSFSISFWWTPKTNDNWTRIFDTLTDGSYSKIFVQVGNCDADHSSIDFRIWTDDSNYRRVTYNDFEYDTLYHIVLILDRDNDNIKMYANGEEVGDLTVIGTLPTFTTTWSLHLFRGASGAPLDDTIDQIRIYNKVLTRSEVWGLYAYPAGSPAYNIAFSQIGGDGVPDAYASYNPVYIQTDAPAGSDGAWWYDSDAYVLYKYDGGWTTVSNSYNDLSQFFGDLDDISDGASYVRAPAAWKYTGKVTINGGAIEADTIAAGALSVTTLSSIVADIGTITAGILRSSDSNFEIDLDNKTIYVGSGAQLQINAASGILVSGGAGISLTADADLNLNSSGSCSRINFTGGTNSGYIQGANTLFSIVFGSYGISFSGSSGTFVIYGTDISLNTSATAFYSNGTTTLGTVGNPWGAAYMGALSCGAITATGLSFGTSGIVSGSSYVALTGGSTTLYVGGNVCRPTADATIASGGSSYRWSGVYCDNLYETCLYLDDEDDLFILHSMRPKEDEFENGKPKLDLLSLPAWMTNKTVLREEIRSEMGDMISDEDFDKLLTDENELGYRLYRNAGHYNDVVAGAVRQLDHKVDNEILALRSELQELRESISPVVH